MNITVTGVSPRTKYIFDQIFDPHLEGFRGLLKTRRKSVIVYNKMVL